jgi:hypothetical protein
MLKDSNGIRDIIFFITLLVLARNISVINSKEIQKHNITVVEYQEVLDYSKRLRASIKELINESHYSQTETLVLKKINKKIIDIEKKLTKKTSSLFITGPFNAALTPIKKYNFENFLLKTTLEVGQIINKISAKNTTFKSFTSLDNLEKNIDLIEKTTSNIN